MTKYARTFALFSTAVLLSATGAWSQDSQTLHPRLTPPPTSVWPVDDVHQGEALTVITTAEPTKRQACRVRSISEDELVCAGKHGHALSLRKEEIGALTVVRSDRSWGGFAGASIVSMIGAAIFYGAIVVATVSTPLIAVAVPIALVGAVGGVGGIVGAIFCLTDNATESLLYQKPGEALQLSLRS